MAHWRLVFRCPQPDPALPPLPIATVAELVSDVLGVPVEVAGGPLTGNPRDMFTRIATITGQRSDVRFEVSTMQWAASASDTNPMIGDLHVMLDGPPSTFAAKLDIYDKLRDAFATLGSADATLITAPYPIVDNAEAIGELATAARLRAEIRQALIGEAHKYTSVRIVDTRVDDIEAVLAAYPSPEKKDGITLENCKLGKLPAGVARFTNVRFLKFVDTATDLEPLRGVSFPRIAQLLLQGSNIKRITREDVAGLPSLVELDLHGSAVEELDPRIIEVCPKLQHVCVSSTPLEARMTALRAAWNGVTVD